MKEQVKQEEKDGAAQMTQESQVNGVVTQRPWINQLADKDPNASKMVKGCAKVFNKNKKLLMRALSNIQGLDAPVESIMGYFDNSDEIALAVTIQNCLHPKMG